MSLGKFLLLLGGLIVIGLIFGHENEKSTGSTTTTSARAPVPDPTDKIRLAESTQVLRVTAQQILDYYETNEVATDNWLKGHIIEVAGIVKSIDKSVWDTMYVRLVTNNDFNPTVVRVNSREESKIATLRRGQSVVFRCPKMVRWVGSPTGEECILMSTGY
jgi:hypothetical protein